MNSYQITQAMLNLGYQSPISVELDTLEIWLGDEENKTFPNEDEVAEIMAEAKTVE